MCFIHSYLEELFLATDDRALLFSKIKDKSLNRHRSYSRAIVTYSGWYACVVHAELIHSFLGTCPEEISGRKRALPEKTTQKILAVIFGHFQPHCCCTIKHFKCEKGRIAAQVLPPHASANSATSSSTPLEHSRWSCGFGLLPPG
jgi:hypothetical protein